MTKDEALEELDSLIIPRDGKQDKLADAFDMAIEALKQEPCDDCISRQAVLDVTWEEPSYTDALNVLTEVRDKVKALPPVNPQKPCKDCQYKEWLEGEDLPPVNPQEPCEDAISRQAVLKIIDGWYEQNRDTDNIEDLIVLITYMDSVNPQKPKSECEHDHEILKAYSDGASAVLDNVRAEIDTARFVDKDTKHCRNANATGLEVALDIIDKYIEEGKA